ncbi:relaxase/mobilization nuclease domain-containing protein [Rhodomicrobium sp. Az07]|uniref:TraI/MobA(P) family conjugative relaxase n=1 Tax=Rhodomicrobium sp. Az07 TaxID=2839034 RepID=UPI001BEA6136|nr:TraI/MobA(P) family conjugative relaxase [Rhodomicrobium sp. Az07]MBT3072027.1 relaxase/mobilization nuclease domain-containing protein [Rhodomicrobium sp. Az07]
MIAKRILRPKAASNFGRLGAYILGDGQTPSETLTTRTFSYILDGQEGAGRVGTVRVTNCMSEAPDLAIKEILVTQALNKRSRSDRTYHLVVSFEPGETPTPAQLEDIENELCAAAGLGRHQRISALHLDRAHLHLHIAINKIDPDSLRCVEPYYDKRKLMAACVSLELKHGLAQTNHGLSKRKRPRGRAADLEAHAAEVSFLSFVKDKIEAPLLAALGEKACWRDIHAIMACEGLTLKRRGAGLVIADAKSRLAVKASTVNRAFSMKELTSRLGAFQPGLAEPATVQDGYGRAPLYPLNTASLYVDYVRQRQQGLEARHKSREVSAAARNEAYAAFAKRRFEVSRSGLTRLGKKARRAELRLMRSRALAALADTRREREAAIEETYFFTWVSYLQARAKASDRDALRALRASAAPGAKTAAAFLTAKDAGAARTIILRDLNPVIGRNGELVYRLADGGAVTDEKLRIRIDKASYQAAIVALTLGAQRFSGQALAVEGTRAFKRQAVEAAAALSLAITFSDPAMEAERQRLMMKNTPRPRLSRP